MKLSYENYQKRKEREGWRSHICLRMFRIQEKKSLFMWAFKEGIAIAVETREYKDETESYEKKAAWTRSWLRQSWS